MSRALILLAFLALGISPLHAGTVKAFFSDRAGFDLAAGTPPVVIDFENIPPGTNITGTTIAGVTFLQGLQSGTPLIVVDYTFTPATGFVPVVNIALNTLPPTNGGTHVLSPGGEELSPPSPTLENDDIEMGFDPPVCAVGFDILFQELDCCSGVSITVFDADDNILFQKSPIPTGYSGSGDGGGAPGGSTFVGFAANSQIIAKIVIDETDSDTYWPDANVGLDTVRLARDCPFCTECTLCPQAFPLPKGINWLALPTTTSNLKTAKDICDLSPDIVFVRQGTDMSALTLNCPSSCNGAGEPGCDCFCLDPGEGFWVETSTSVKVPILGARDDVVSITYGNDSLISLPYNTTLVTAQDVCTHFVLPSSAQVRQLNCTTGVTSAHMCGNAGPFTLLGPCSAIMVSAMGTHPNPVGGASLFPPCVSTNQAYCITGAATNVPYSWAIDLGMNGLDTASEPYVSSAPGVTTGLPASSLAMAFSNSINGLGFSGLSAVASDNCFTITAPEDFDLYVGISGTPPACKVGPAGCSYNPKIILGPGPSLPAPLPQRGRIYQPAVIP